MKQAVQSFFCRRGRGPAAVVDVVLNVVRFSVVGFYTVRFSMVVFLGVANLVEEAWPRPRGRVGSASDIPELQRSQLLHLSTVRVELSEMLAY